MSWVKCYDVVTEVTDEATRQFHPTMRENEVAKSALRFLCAWIDTFTEKNDAYAYEVDVDEVTKELTITVECEMFEVDEITDVFYDIVRNADRICLSAIDDINVRVSFTFQLNLWEKA